jgi:hypothetical protein
MIPLWRLANLSVRTSEVDEFMLDIERAFAIGLVLGYLVGFTIATIIFIRERGR